MCGLRLSTAFHVMGQQNPFLWDVAGKQHQPARGLAQIHEIQAFDLGPQPECSLGSRRYSPINGGLMFTARRLAAALMCANSPRLCRPARRSNPMICLRSSSVVCPRKRPLGGRRIHRGFFPPTGLQLCLKDVCSTEGLRSRRHLPSDWESLPLRAAVSAMRTTSRGFPSDR